MRYQETLDDSSQPFQRECASRYEVLRREVLSKYQRPFSVLDLGANLGYFSLRTAREFPQATVVAVDNRRDLVSEARRSGLRNVVVVDRRLSGRDLLELSKSEVFDVALALNVLHHMGDWRDALTGLLGLGNTVVVETPGVGDTGALRRGNHSAILGALSFGDVVHRSEAHTTEGAERLMFRLAGDAGEITAQSLDSAERGAPRVRAEVCDGEIKFGRGERREFVPGINLWNAHLLGMAWPTDARDRIRAEVRRLAHEARWHDDLRPWNFVLHGDRAVAIDTGNKRWRTEPEPDGLSKCLAMLG